MTFGGNNNNEASSVRKPSANSNKVSMPFELCAFQDEIKSGGEDTFETGRPSDNSAMIRSNLPKIFKFWTKHKPCEHGQPINKNKIY